MLIDIPRSLRLKLGEDGCTALVQIMNDHFENSKGEIVELCVQRFERRLSEESAKTRLELSDRITVLSDRTAKEHVSTLRWLVVLLVVQVALAALSNIV
ncbi:MAG TPA: hypothetical protein VK661_09350 [Planctomycetota bacterium]|nr:hypothetical protein [Planctomycetota bacterium]